MIKFRLVGEPAEVDDILQALKTTPGVVIRLRGRQQSREQEGKVLQYAEIRRVSSAPLSPASPEAAPSAAQSTDYQTTSAGAS